MGGAAHQPHETHTQRPVPHPGRTADHVGRRARLADRLRSCSPRRGAARPGRPMSWPLSRRAVRPRRRVAARAGRQGGRDAELVAVGRVRPDDLGRVDLGGEAPLLVVFDRPTSPGNLGTLVRSADAFGARGVLVAGHAADIYDPRTLRASTGSLFALPVVHVPAAADVLAWLAHRSARWSTTADPGHPDTAAPIILFIVAPD